MSNEETSHPEEGQASEPGPFDVETIRHLVRLMTRHDLNEIDLKDGERRVRLRRGIAMRVQASPESIAPAPATPAPASAAPPPTATPSVETEAPASNLIEVKSPTPGTFYTKPDPDSEAYVKVGSRVSPDTTVCQIEAMKMFNEIKAECSGTVAEIVAENGQFVEYGTVLFRINPS